MRGAGTAESCCSGRGGGRPLQWVREPSVVVPGVGPRKPAAALRRSRATAAVLPLLLLLLRLSLNDGLVLNCPPRGAEQSQHQHRTTAAVLLLLWNLLSTARTAILQLASTATQWRTVHRGHSCVIVEGHIKKHPRSFTISDIWSLFHQVELFSLPHFPPWLQHCLSFWEHISAKN